LTPRPDKKRTIAKHQKLNSPYVGLVKAWKILKGSFWGFWLITTLLCLNMVQTMSLVVFPFSQRIFRAANRWMANTWWSFLVYVVERKSKLKVTFWGEKVPERENAIVISNHQCMSDIPSLMTLAIRKYRIGDLKFFVKDILKYVPGVGWGMLFLDCLFVKRDWLKDKSSIKNTFSAIRTHSVPIWLVSFLEGTRITASKLKSSQAFAKKQGLWQPSHVLIPRTKGFVASIEGLRDHVHAIYDLTIGYPDGIPSLMQSIMGLVPALHIHVRRTDIKDLPEDADSLSEWVLETFRSKDNLMAHFHEFGVFQGEPMETA